MEDETGTVEDELPSEVINEFGLDVGAVGGDDKLEDDSVADSPEDTVGLDVGGGSGEAVGILVELELTTVRLRPRAS